MTRTRGFFALSAALALGGCAAQDGGAEPSDPGDEAGGEGAPLLDDTYVGLTPCGDALCEGDEYCCNESCSICAPLDGGTCTQQICDDDPDLGEQCGERECPIGQICCNPECGVCAADQDACPEIGCGPLELLPCGDAYCAPGHFCCNDSCGICAPIGGSCTLQLCDPEPVFGEACGETLCPLGEVCCNPVCGTCAPAHEDCPGPDAITACDGAPVAPAPAVQVD